MFFIARIVDGIFGGNFPLTKADVDTRISFSNCLNFRLKKDAKSFDFSKLFFIELSSKF